MRKSDPDLQARRRQEIIDAATACFVANGFHQTSMANITAAAGLSMGLLYRYFASKTAIIDAVAQRDRDAVIAAVATLPDSGDIAAAWVELLLAIIDEVTAPGTVELLNEIHAEAGRNPELLRQLQLNDRLMMAAIAAKLTAQRVADPDGSAVLLMALAEGLALRRYLAPSTPLAALIVRSVAALMPDCPGALPDPAGRAGDQSR